MTSNPSTPARPAFPVSRRPRCPAYVDVTSADDLMPYLEAVAKRAYTPGALHVTWDLQRGEKVLLRADNWHDPMVIEACEKLLRQYECDYEIEMVDRGPEPQLDGHDEIEIFLGLTKELALDMDRWVQMDKDGVYDKVLWGFGGPVLAESKMKIGRMPFITPEMLATPAHLIPGEVLAAIDAWTDRTIKGARTVRITDPEGTDISYPLPDAYFNEDRTEWNGPRAAEWWPQSPELMQKYMPGHISARPLFMTEEPGVDAINGVIAGTMNHVGPYPRITMQVRDSKITSIEGGGTFGDKLRALDEKTQNIQYPGYPGPGLMWLFEVSIGTNPKVHRPRKNYLSGWICGIYERMRSGVIHLGFGSIITSAQEIEAAKAGHPTGHWHVHLNFPTVTIETVTGESIKVIDEGRLCALDDPEVRKVAERAGADPDIWLQEDWIPAVPGLNCEGSYETYAADPTKWTKTELEICRNYHPLFMRMVNAEPAPGQSHCH
jgi:hypothetical protein